MLVVLVAATVALLGCAGPIDVEQPGVTQRTLAYGPGPDQVIDLAWPSQAAGTLPTVVLVHGGFWQQGFGSDLMAPLADSVVAQGWVAANIEYRRVGGAGGWPMTFVDVATAVDALADADAPIDLDRVVVVGHSAGGHLATWLASRPNLPSDVVGANPMVRPCAAVSQAGVVALADAARDRVGGAAVVGLMGGMPDEVPDRYAVGDPLALAPPPVAVLLVHATADALVPISQSRRYAARAGERADLVEVAGDHFTLIDPRDPSWTRSLDWIATAC